MKASAQPGKGRGRPRDDAADRAILKTTMQLLGEVGLHGLTIEAIAARAGVSRPTVYRRWRNREEIVVAALVARVRPLRDPDTGDTRRDLFTMLSALVADLDEHVGSSVLGVHASLNGDPALAATLRKRYLGPRAVVLSNVLARGIERGELRADLDPEIMRDLLFGPPIYHLLITAKPIGKRALRATFDATWDALCSRG